MSRIVKHGHNYILELEIDNYKDVFLNDFYTDSIIDFEYIYCEEIYTGCHDLQRRGDSNWQITVPIGDFVSSTALGQACQELMKHQMYLLSYSVSKTQYENHEITILIDHNMSIYDAFNYAVEKRDIVLDYISSLENHTISRIVKQTVTEKLPIYLRAMKKVELELTNFRTDDACNHHKIIEISSRVKEIDSIQEKIYRKRVCQFDIFEKFDDIAGVRCTCEFLSDVYDVLLYIQNNPLLCVKSIEDKIKDPSEAGYRGVHIIVTTDVYYHDTFYENIKVEIQLRTAFQNAWSMKTHQLTYKRESAIPEEISNAMRAMSDALNDADHVAQQIKDKLWNIE